MLYTLTIPERIQLLDILPAQGSYITLKIVRELRETLSFSEAEIAEFDLVQDDHTVRWCREKERPKEVELGRQARKIIEETLDKLSKQQALRADQMPLYERFVEDKPEA